MAKATGIDIRHNAALTPTNLLRGAGRVADEMFYSGIQGARRLSGWLGRLGDSLNRHPAVDILDRPDNLIVRAEMPGLQKEDIAIWLDENRVTLRAFGVLPHLAGEERFARREMSRNDFYRSIRLPCEVAAEGAHATLQNGILEIIIPKAESSRRRRVEVTAQRTEPQ